MTRARRSGAHEVTNALGKHSSKWARFKAWSTELDSQALRRDWQPIGLDLAEEPIRSQIFKNAWRSRMWVRPAIVVTDDRFISQTEAAALLKSRAAPRPNIGILIARGLIQRCFRARDGADGVTLDSVQEELEWRQSATFWRRLRRRLGGILHWV